MVQSAEEKRVKNAEYMRIRRQNPEYRAKEAERMRILRQNPEYRAKEAETRGVWSQTPQGKKSRILTHWREEGLIDSDMDNYEKLYCSYLQSTHCDVCKIEFKNSYDRCMDRDHKTNLFRQFLCRDCNIQDRWKKKISTAS